MLKTKTDGKSQTTTFVYDKLKRLKEKQYPSGQKIIYAFSGENLGSVQDQVANETTNFSYDSSYRLSSIVNPRGTISYGYTAGDQLQTYQVNSDPGVAFGYYDDGSVKTIARSGDNPLTYCYLLTGQKSQVVYPNNASVNLSYDDQGRLTEILNRKPDSSILSSYTYGYDYNQATGSYSMKGFRTSMTDQSALQEKYYFDNLYQLTRVDYGNGDVHQWSYDDIGNRIQQTVTPSGQSPIVTNYSYYQNAQVRNSQRLASDGTNSYAWDNNGNLLTKGSSSYTWSYDNRLTGISGGSINATYVYDYLGERIKKNVGGIETAYLYRAEDIIKETSGGTITDYLHGIGIDDPVMLDRAGAKSFYYTDGLGSIREITDVTGTPQNSYSYGSWGELRSSSGTVANNYGYTGREFAEEGMYFHRARYMDPGIGRFISEDPIGINGGINLYEIGFNNPNNFLDLFGTQSTSPASLWSLWHAFWNQLFKPESDAYNAVNQAAGEGTHQAGEFLISTKNLVDNAVNSLQLQQKLSNIIDYIDEYWTKSLECESCMMPCQGKVITYELIYHTTAEISSEYLFGYLIPVEGQIYFVLNALMILAHEFDKCLDECWDVCCWKYGH